MLLYMNFFRTWAAILIYTRTKNKIPIQGDLNSIMHRTSIMDFHRAMCNKGNCFRNLFYARVHAEFPLLTKISKVLCPQMKALEIDVRNGIGKGMKIYHGYSTIVFADTIGDNFTFYQQVTIGRGKNYNGIDIPVIGNNVTIYAGAIVVGGIHIGDNSVIGAGAVVVKDVPANTTVVGAPARMILQEG